jgi:putative addiction module component (TIGR02574 family)
MARNFRELEARMSSEALMRSNAKAKKMLDESPAEECVESAWDSEIKRRVDDIRQGRVETIPGERLRERLDARRRDA